MHDPAHAILWPASLDASRVLARAASRHSADAKVGSMVHGPDRKNGLWGAALLATALGCGGESRDASPVAKPIPTTPPPAPIVDAGAPRPRWLDESFGQLGTIDFKSSIDVLLDPQGRLIVLELAKQTLHRLHPDGQPDRKFGTNGATVSPFPLGTEKEYGLRRLGRFPDGRYLAFGHGRASGPLAIGVRFTVDGLLDGDQASFEVPSAAGCAWSSYTLTTAPGGAILVAALDFNGSFRAARVTTAGFDTSFGEGGCRVTDLGIKLGGGRWMPSDGKTGQWLIGYAAGRGQVLAKVTEDVVLDPSWGTMGLSPLSNVGSATLGPNGRIAVATWDDVPSVVMLTSSGTIDSTFGDGGRHQLTKTPKNSPFSMVFDTRGRLFLLLPEAEDPNAYERTYVLRRILPDGKDDPTFHVVIGDSSEAGLVRSLLGAPLLAGPPGRVYALVGGKIVALLDPE